MVILYHGDAVEGKGEEESARRWSADGSLLVGLLWRLDL